MKAAHRLDIVSGVLVLGMFVAGAVIWPQAPERIPTHWNIRGEVDGYGGKFVGLLLLPLTTLGLYGAMFLLPWIDPGRENYANFQGVMRTLRAVLVVFLSGLYAATICAALGVRVDMNRIVFGLLGLLFVVLGGVLGKVRPNWFVGIRTPWTLSSKLAWTHTHRLGGKLFIAMGVVAWGAAMVNRPWAVVAMIITMVVSVFGMVAYSYYLWRIDPERIAPAGTSAAEGPTE